MSSEIWYYAQLGQQIGPVDLEFLRQLVGQGKLRHSDFVWREGTPEWVKAGTVPEVGFTPPPEPPRRQPSLPVVGQQAYAGFWLRVGATVIDVILLNFGSGIAAGSLFTVAVSPNDHEVFQFLLFLIGTVGGWLYHAFMESSTTQATLGKMICGIRVTDENGNRITFQRATGRHFGKYLSCLIFCVGYMMAGWTQKRQALHDILAQTLVVRKS